MDECLSAEADGGGQRRLGPHCNGYLKLVRNPWLNGGLPSKALFASTPNEQTIIALPAQPDQPAMR